MKELQVFKNEEFGEVRSLVIDNEPYFVGKDIASVLGYSNPRKAIIDHVDDEDKTDGVTICDSIGREQRPVLINESGLYSLILSSKLPAAKKFKHWVTREVLPSIRKTGSYNQYQLKSTSAGEIARLIKPIINVMNKQGSKPSEIASQVELILNQFGIRTIPGFVKKYEEKSKQLAIVFAEIDD